MLRYEKLAIVYAEAFEKFGERTAYESGFQMALKLAAQYVDDGTPNGEYEARIIRAIGHEEVGD
jgi:hypothetical protein